MFHQIIFQSMMSRSIAVAMTMAAWWMEAWWMARLERKSPANLGRKTTAQ
jgi:hypothetical protein